MLVGKDAKMPDLLILIGTLGGCFFLVPIGFIAGPIVFGLFITIWHIYGEAFRDILPPVKQLRHGEGEASVLRVGGTAIVPASNPPKQG
jgi:hypothetical protein